MFSSWYKSFYLALICGSLRMIYYLLLGITELVDITWINCTVPEFYFHFGLIEVDKQTSY